MSAAQTTDPKLREITREEYEQGKPQDRLLESTIERTIEEQASRLKFSEDKFTFDQRRAKLYAISGMFGKIGERLSLEEAVAQALVRIELGESMGFSAAESLQGINVIANRAAVSAELQAARMQAAGFGWDVEFHWSGRPNESECTGCTLWMKFRQRQMMDHSGQPVTVAFLKSHAQQMKTTIYDNGNKKRVSLVEKWEHGEGALKEDYYFARAITRARRRHAPAVMSPSVLSIDEAMDLEAEPVTVVISEAKPEPEKQAGNAALKDALKNNQKGDTSNSGASPASETPKSTAKDKPSSAKPADTEGGGGTGSGPSSSAPARQTVQQTTGNDVVFNTIEEMEEKIRVLHLEITDDFGERGMEFFDRIVQENGGYPKTIAAGEKIFALGVKLRDSLQDQQKGGRGKLKI